MSIRSDETRVSTRDKLEALTTTVDEIKANMASLTNWIMNQEARRSRHGNIRSMEQEVVRPRRGGRVERGDQVVERWLGGEEEVPSEDVNPSAQQDPQDNQVIEGHNEQLVEPPIAPRPYGQEGEAHGQALRVPPVAPTPPIAAVQDAPQGVQAAPIVPPRNLSGAHAPRPQHAPLGQEFARQFFRRPRHDEVQRNQGNPPPLNFDEFEYLDPYVDPGGRGGRGRGRRGCHAWTWTSRGELALSK